MYADYKPDYMIGCVTNMPHLMFISLFMLKLSNPNGWKYYMQYKHT